MTIIEKPLLSHDMYDNVEEFYANFIDRMSTLETLQILIAANYLDIKPSDIVWIEDW
jgi:hypothetical protein